MLKHKLLVGVVASASVLGIPAAVLPGVPQNAARAADYDTVHQEWLATEREMNEEKARYAAAMNGVDRKGNKGKQLTAQHEQAMNRIRNRRQALRAQLDRMGANAGKPQPGQVQQKLDTVADQVAAEKQRHAEKMRNLPKGSAAAAAEV